MVAGHMDEVGWMVTDVEDSGYVRIRPLGGWWPHVMLGQRVTVRTRTGDYLGVIGSKPLDTPGIRGAERNPERLGRGAQVLLLEGRVVAHPRLARFVLDVAEAEDIPHHTTTLQGGSTDANRFQITGTGIPSMAICVPSRYIHSHSSIIDQRDYESALRLLVAVTKRLDEDTVARIRG